MARVKEHEDETRFHQYGITPAKTVIMQMRIGRREGASGAMLLGDRRERHDGHPTVHPPSPLLGWPDKGEFF